MKERRRRREMRLARNESSDLHDGESLARKWLAADPAPPEIAAGAKAAFARHQRPLIVLPMTLEIHGGDGGEAESDQPIDLLVFEDEDGTIEVQVGHDAGAIVLQCTLRGGRVDPIAVTAESPNADHPMVRSDTGKFRMSGLPHGPLRVAVEFAGEPARSIATSWFTA